MPIILALLLLALTGEGVSMAADRAQPGDSLYYIKVHVNGPIQRAFQDDDHKPVVIPAPAALQPDTVPATAAAPIVEPTTVPAPVTVPDVVSTPVPAIVPVAGAVTNPVTITPGVKPSITGAGGDDEDGEEREGRGEREDD